MRAWRRRPVLFAVLVLGIGGPAAQSAAQRPANGSPATTSIPYEVVEKRGGMRIAVIEPKYRTEQSLRALGDVLNHDFRSSSVIVIVFDDRKVAALYDRMTDSPDVSLGSERADRNYDLHQVAVYSSGDHKYAFSPNGDRGMGCTDFGGHRPKHGVYGNQYNPLRKMSWSIAAPTTTARS